MTAHEIFEAIRSGVIQFEEVDQSEALSSQKKKDVKVFLLLWQESLLELEMDLEGPLPLPSDDSGSVVGSALRAILGGALGAVASVAA